MSEILELTDRIELNSIYADTSNMTRTNFFENNESLTGSLSRSLLNPLFSTDITNNPVYVVGVNQQTNKECFVKWSNVTTADISFGSEDDWDYGYYQIFVRQYQSMTETEGLNSYKYYNLNKKPIFWNKSPLRFMTYINSGSFEIGCPLDEFGNENHNMIYRNKITISRPFFIQRTLLTADLFNKVVQTVSGSTYTTYSWDQKTITTINTPKRYICNRRYYSDGKWACYTGSSQWNSRYPSTTNLSSITGNYNADYAQAGGSSNTFTITQESLNETPVYMLNSIGLTAAGGSNVYATKSFAEHFMDLGYTFDNASSELNGLGWHWYIPTECQWEYACRAGTLTAFNNGVNLENPYPSTTGTSDGTIPENNIDEVAWWYNRLSGNNSLKGTGLLKPNKWGLFDMHGDLFEWCVDKSGMNYDNISGDIYTSDINVSTGDTGTFAGSPLHISGSAASNRVLRGGGYSIYNTACARALRSAYRYMIYPMNCRGVYGVRMSAVKL